MIKILETTYFDPFQILPACRLRPFAWEMLEAEISYNKLR